MLLPQSSEPVDQFIEAIVEQSTTQRPMLSFLVIPFAQLFLRQAALIKDLQKLPLGAPLLFSAERLASGVPVFAQAPLQQLHHLLSPSLTGLMPTLEKTFAAFQADFEAIEAARLRGDLPLATLAESLLNGRFDESSTSVAGVSQHALLFATYVTLSTALRAATGLWVNQVRKTPWAEGYCPVCGNLPAISYLSLSEDDPNDASHFVKSHGGKRFLHCALCGYEWRFNRNACPVCVGLPDNAAISYLKVRDEDAGERVDVCGRCNLYLPCIDLRQKDRWRHMDLAAVALVHLGLVAAQKGYSPMCWTPWNHLE